MITQLGSTINAAFDLTAKTGQAQGGGATTITLAAGESATDNIYNSWLCIPTGGTGDDQTPRRITAYDGSTKVATVTPGWDVQPDATTTYKLLPTIGSLSISELDEKIAVNLRIGDGTNDLDAAGQTLTVRVTADDRRVDNDGEIVVEADTFSLNFDTRDFIVDDGDATIRVFIESDNSADTNVNVEAAVYRTSGPHVNVSGGVTESNVVQADGVSVATNGGSFYVDVGYIFSNPIAAQNAKTVFNDDFATFWNTTLGMPNVNVVNWSGNPVDDETMSIENIGIGVFETATSSVTNTPGNYGGVILNIETDADGANSQATGIKAQTDKLTFTGDDVHSLAQNMRGTDSAITDLSPVTSQLPIVLSSDNIASAVLDAKKSDHIVAGSYGETISDIETQIDSINATQSIISNVVSDTNTMVETLHDTRIPDTISNIINGAEVDIGSIKGEAVTTQAGTNFNLFFNADGTNTDKDVDDIGTASVSGSVNVNRLEDEAYNQVASAVVNRKPSLRAMIADTLDRLLKAAGTPTGDEIISRFDEATSPFSTHNSTFFAADYKKALTSVGVEGGILVATKEDGSGDIIIDSEHTGGGPWKFVREDGTVLTVGSGGDVGMTSFAQLHPGGSEEASLRIILLDHAVSYKTHGIQPLKLPPASLESLIDWENDFKYVNALPIMGLDAANRFAIRMLANKSVLNDEITSFGFTRPDTDHEDFYDKYYTDYQSGDAGNAYGVLIPINGEIRFLPLGVSFGVNITPASQGDGAGKGPVLHAHLSEIDDIVDTLRINDGQSYITKQRPKRWSLDEYNAEPTPITLAPVQQVIDAGVRTTSPITLEMFQHSSKTYNITVKDANGDPVDLSVLTLRFFAMDETDSPAKQFEIANADISITGDDNEIAQFTVDESDSATASEDLSWRLKVVSGDVLAWGRFRIKPSIVD